MIAHEYGHGSKLVPIVVYGLAATVSTARYAAERHYASDIVAGGAMGWFIGDFVYRNRHDAALDARLPAWKRALAHVHVGGIE